MCVRPTQVEVSYIIPLTVNRWIGGDVPIYLKFALKVTHTFRKRRFRLLVPQP